MKKIEDFTKNNHREKTALFTCGMEIQYPRTSPILNSLKKYYKVREITSRHSSDIFRLLKLWVCLFFEFLLQKKYDLIFVGYLPQPLMPLIKFFKRDQLIIDPLISIYDTLCLDRKSFKPNSLVGKLSFWFDKKSFQWADKITTDSQIHGDYFSELFNIPRNKFYTFYNGVDENIFYPRKIEKTDDKFTIFFPSSYLPLHGLDIIIKAVKLLSDEKDIIFQMVGRGPMRSVIQKMARDLGLNNIEFIDWIPYEETPKAIAQSDICLGGHFSDNQKAKRVISGKTFLFLAMRKPTIIGESPATQALFKHGHDVYMCQMENEKALARAILELFKNQALREKIANGGYQTFRSNFSSEKIQKNLLNIIKD